MTILKKHKCYRKMNILFKQENYSVEMALNSWLTVSDQIVKSLSLCYKKSFFYMVQPIDLIFCKMIEIIEQNFFNRADFLIRS